MISAITATDPLPYISIDVSNLDQAICPSPSRLHTLATFANVLRRAPAAKEILIKNDPVHLGKVLIKLPNPRVHFLLHGS